ncbi:MAG: HNH endonuclease [Phormidium sp.]
MTQTKIGAIRCVAKKIGISFEEYISNIEAGFKWCTKCKKWRHIGDFVKDKSRHDGRKCVCINCDSKRKMPGPPLRERKSKMIEGFAWCRGCKKWLPSPEIRAGVCKIHAASEARQRYANDEKYRAERRQHSHARKRNVEPIPHVGQEFLMEIFDSKCAYCLQAANSWDHIVPISKGGRTTPGNIVPACNKCNSSKNNQDVFEWMNKKGITPHPEFWERIILAECGLYG